LCAKKIWRHGSVVLVAVGDGDAGDENGIVIHSMDNGGGGGETADWGVGGDMRFFDGVVGWWAVAWRSGRRIRGDEAGDGRGPQLARRLLAGEAASVSGGGILKLGRRAKMQRMSFCSRSFGGIRGAG